MLARRVARLTGLQLETGLSFIRQPDDQRGLGQGDRHANLSNSMVFHKRSASARFILIDDVVTTGSTLVEAAVQSARQGLRCWDFACLPRLACCKMRKMKNRRIFLTLGKGA